MCVRTVQALEAQREREEEERIMEFARRKEQLIVERKVKFKAPPSLLLIALQRYCLNYYS